MIRDLSRVVAALSSEPGVTTGKMFGAQGLKIKQQVFAMEVKSKLVVKLSQERAAELCEWAVAEPFDPGHGRPMKQWATVSKTRQPRLAHPLTRGTRLRARRSV